MRKKAKYDKSYPRRLYTFFLSFDGSGTPPSFPKFARELGVTPFDLEDFRVHKDFDAAYRTCMEIRRDHLIDGALTRRFDPSFVKFLLTEAFAEEKEEDSGLAVTLTVCS